MGIDSSFAAAFGKSQIAAFNTLPARGEGKRAFLSVKDADKPAAADRQEGSSVSVSRCSLRRARRRTLPRHGVKSTPVRKVQEGRPSIPVDDIKDGDVHLVLNTTAGKQEIADSYSIPQGNAHEGPAVLHDPHGRASGTRGHGGSQGGTHERLLAPRYHGRAT